jgi:hypothetical protein
MAAAAQRRGFQADVKIGRGGTQSVTDYLFSFTVVRGAHGQLT